MKLFDGLEGKTFVVTGATSGIGRALVKQLVGFGAHLILIGRSQDKLDALAAELPGDVRSFAIDLTNLDGISPLDSVLPKHIDGLVHAAGIESVETIRNLTYKKFDLIMRVHVYAFVELVKMIDRRKVRGADYLTSIVAISSIASDSGGVGQTMYAASKSALEVVVRLLSKELVRKKIRLNSVKPGIVDTEMTRRWMRRIGIKDIQEVNDMQLSGAARADDVANLIVFLLSDLSTHIVGSSVRIDGGGPSTKVF